MQEAPASSGGGLAGIPEHTEEAPGLPTSNGWAGE